MISSKMLTFFLKATSCQNTCFLDNAACCVIDFFDSMVFDVVCIIGFYKLEGPSCFLHMWIAIMFSSGVL